MNLMMHRYGHIALTERTAAHLDKPVKYALTAENERRRRAGEHPLVNLAREGVQSLLQVGPKRAAALSRHGVYNIGDFARLDPSMVPGVLSAVHAAMRASLHV